ncbi:MAG: phosphate ABC transporter ATP-binding protein [Euryarchaeota archaeon]|nr:phosphate ABC transporter ATP-binding protein [Euryarchaeota archaeon]
MTVLLALEKVTRRFGPVTALDSVSLEAGEGEIVGLLGPSGSGKTTLLRLAGMLDCPTEGRILLEGEQMDAEGDRNLATRRKIAMILQKPVVFRGSVIRNATYGLRLRKVEAEEARARAMEALRDVGLDGMAGRAAHTLSGGEVQRLAFARAAVLRPKLLLLDEFTANLDPANITMLEKAVRRFRESGGTVVMVTHNLPQARRQADRVGLLLSGKLVETGPPQRFFDSPETKEAREFLNGTMVW